MLLASVSVRTLTPCTALPSIVGRQSQPLTKPCSCHQKHFPRVLDILLDLDCRVHIR